MAPRKNRPILYEVAKARKRDPKSPGWSLWDGLTGRAESAPGDEAKSPPAAETPAEPPVPQPTPSKAPAAAPAAPPTAAVSAPAPGPVAAPAPPPATAPTHSPVAEPAASGPPASAAPVHAPASEALTRADMPAEEFTPLDEPADELPPPRAQRPAARGHTIPPAVALRGEASRPPGATAGARALDTSQWLIIGSIIAGLAVLIWLITPLFQAAPADENAPVAAAPPPAAQDDAARILSQINNGETGRGVQRPPVRPGPDPAGTNRPTEGAATSAKPPAEAQPPPAESAAATVDLKKGYHYVVVQHFPTRRAEDAQAAARYLIDEGLACALFPANDIRLLLTEPFLIDQDDAAAAQSERRRADKLLAKVREIGAAYRKGGGGYDFAGASVRKIR